MVKVFGLVLAAAVLASGFMIGFAPTLTLLAITATFAMFFALIKISMV